MNNNQFTACEDSIALWIPSKGYRLDVSQIVDFFPPRKIRLSARLNRRFIVSSNEVIGTELTEDRDWQDLTVEDVYLYGFSRIFFRGGELDGLIGTFEETDRFGVFLTIDESKR